MLKPQLILCKLHTNQDICPRKILNGSLFERTFVIPNVDRNSQCSQFVHVGLGKLIVGIRISKDCHLVAK